MSENITPNEESKPVEENQPILDENTRQWGEVKEKRKYVNRAANFEFLNHRVEVSFFEKDSGLDIEGFIDDIFFLNTAELFEKMNFDAKTRDAFVEKISKILSFK